jgi:hypothetical protein
VTVLEGVGLTCLNGVDGQVVGAILSDMTEHPYDVVIAGIGITPATALAEAAGLEVDNGIKVDAQGRTSDPAIWAAGDCASFPYRGGRIRLESVQNAIDQAEAVAKNLLGADEDYVPHPWFWSDQYDVKLQIAGLNTGYTDVVVRDAGAARSHWYYAGDTLLSVDAMNDPRAYMVGKRLIEMGKSPSREAVADPSRPQGAVARMRDVRIVAGRWRGKALADVGKGDPAAHLRPTTDRVRESLFNLLTNGRFGDLVTGARVLDLFAGTGALGLEALSRGAVHATFVDDGGAGARAAAGQYRPLRRAGGDQGLPPRRHGAGGAPGQSLHARLSRPAIRHGIWETARCPPRGMAAGSPPARPSSGRRRPRRCRRPVSSCWTNGATAAPASACCGRHDPRTGNAG